MKEQPILFSGPMVRAILANRKTVTRRIVNGAPDDAGLAVYGAECTAGDGGVSSACAMFFAGSTVNSRGLGVVRCPFGSPGDRLWVRETWRYHGWTEDGAPWIKYAADYSTRLVERIPDEWSDRLADIWADLSDDANMAIDGRAADRKWRPSIFLPRWASRLTLEVVSVRVERLQEIDELDALHEGVQGQAVDGVLDGKPGRYVVGSARDEFAALWDSINADRAAWASNPWVWRVEFKVVQP